MAEDINSPLSGLEPVSRKPSRPAVQSCINRPDTGLYLTSEILHKNDLQFRSHPHKPFISDNTSTGEMTGMGTKFCLRLGSTPCMRHRICRQFPIYCAAIKMNWDRRLLDGSLMEYPLPKDFHFGSFKCRPCGRQVIPNVCDNPLWKRTNKQIGFNEIL